MAHADLFDRIMTEARVRLPGALDEALKVELYGVLDEFFRHTLLWQESIPLFVNPDQKMYDIDSNEWIATVNELMYVTNDSEIIIPASMEVAGVLDLRDYPPNELTYIVRMALGCADALDEDGYPQVPMWIVTKYREVFKDGLISRMAMQPAKPYFNEKLVMYHASRFRQGMVSAYADMKQKNTFNTQAWQFPRNFATSRRQ